MEKISVLLKHWKHELVIVLGFSSYTYSVPNMNLKIENSFITKRNKLCFSIEEY